MMKYVWSILFFGSLVLGGWLFYTNYQLTVKENERLTGEVEQATKVVESAELTLDAYAKAYKKGQTIRQKGNTRKRRAQSYVATEKSKAGPDGWINKPVPKHYVDWLLREAD